MVVHQVVVLADIVVLVEVLAFPQVVTVVAVLVEPLRVVAWATDLEQLEREPLIRFQT